MAKNAEQEAKTRQGRLQAILLTATADFLEAQGGMRWKDVVASYNAALDGLQISKIEHSPHPSYDLLNGGQ